MAVRLRLTRMGRRKRPFYRIVAADARAPRDGKFLEQIGYYDPMTEPPTIKVDHEKALKWLKNGAQPTETVRSILSKEGVLLKLHLWRKGKSEEEIERIYQEWRKQKEEKLQKIKEEVARRRQEAYEKALEHERKIREQRKQKQQTTQD